jgi:two-component system chemotaxis response regulator CheY
MTTLPLATRALIVDDSRVIRTIVGRALIELGFETQEAGNGREALAVLEKGPLPGMVMVDWNMPEMSGLDMVKAIRANAAWNVLKLIMITSENEMERVQEALQAGADEYIMKPFSKDMIQEKLMLIGVPIPSASAV